MSSATSLLLFVLAISSCRAVSESPPAIPCTYSAEVREEVSGGRSSFWTHHQVETTLARMTGHLSGEHPRSNTTVIFVAPASTLYLVPWFDRLTCSVVPLGKPPMCPRLAKTAVRVGGGVRCGTVETRRNCEMWVMVTDTVNDTWFLRERTAPGEAATPVQRVTVLRQSGKITTRTWVSFVARTPDPSVFVFPRDLPCNDMTEAGETAEDLVDPPALFDRDPTSFGREHEFRSRLVNSAEELKRVKVAASRSTWTAAAHPQFDGMTFEDVRRTYLMWPNLVSGAPMWKNARRPQSDYHVADLPRAFDSRKRWPLCETMGLVHAQKSCGSCWAFAATEVLADRLCIRNPRVSNLTLSPQYLVDCYDDEYGCQGGFADISWQGLSSRGVVSESCVPYEAKAHPYCPSSCADGSPLRLYRSMDAYGLVAGQGWNRTETMISMQREIMDNGPIEIIMWVFSDFMTYKGGVYQRTPGSSVVGEHAVKVLGWGEDEYTRLPYWLIVSTWGTEWGEWGFARILRGVDHCSCESRPTAGHPERP